jgi:hypothetical protein
VWGDIRLINFDIIFEKTCLFRQKKKRWRAEALGSSSTPFFVLNSPACRQLSNAYLNSYNTNFLPSAHYPFVARLATRVATVVRRKYEATIVSFRLCVQ